MDWVAARRGVTNSSPSELRSVTCDADVDADKPIRGRAFEMLGILRVAGVWRAVPDVQSRSIAIDAPDDRLGPRPAARNAPCRRYASLPLDSTRGTQARGTKRSETVGDAGALTVLASRARRRPRVEGRGGRAEARAGSSVAGRQERARRGTGRSSSRPNSSAPHPLRKRSSLALFFFFCGVRVRSLLREAASFGWCLQCPLSKRLRQRCVTVRVCEEQEPTLKRMERNGRSGEEGASEETALAATKGERQRGAQKIEEKKA